MIDVLEVKEPYAAEGMDRDTILYLLDLCEQLRQANEKINVIMRDSNYDVDILIFKTREGKTIYRRTYSLHKLKVDTKELRTCILELKNLIKNETLGDSTSTDPGDI